MPIDSTGLYSIFATRPKSIADYDQQNQDFQKNALAINTAQQEADEKNALRSYVHSGADLSTPEGQQGLVEAAPTIAPAILKSLQDSRAAQALTGKNTAEAGLAQSKTADSQLDQQIKAHNFQLQQLAPVSTPQEARQWAISGLKSGLFTPEQFAQGFQSIPDDPQQFAAWKQKALQGGMAIKDQLEQQQQLQIARERNQTQIATNAASNATSRANNSATIAAENQRAGIGAGGNLDANTERTAQAIASGQLPAPTGMALLNPKNQRILGRVMEINPNYDYTTVAAKKKAASDFTTGTLGNAMRSFDVAGQHLDQLGKLVDALDNGNIQLVNKFGNTYAQQTGSPAPTNFDAAKDVVSKEVVKAIVAGGGGVDERKELARLMDNAKAPAQLKGVIQQYRTLMSAQHDALLAQRRAAGLPDSTLPQYGGQGALPSADAIAAELKRRQGK